MSPGYDVIIAGSGMVGTALACALGRQGWRVALIDPQPTALDWPAASVDLRVSALTPASTRLLEQLKAWQHIPSERLGPYENMRVWDANGGGEIFFEAATRGLPYLGHIVENREIQRALWLTARESPSIDPHIPAQLAAWTLSPDSVTVELVDGRRLEAKLLVGADGAQSTVRRLAAIDSQGADYEQAAVVTTVSTERPHRRTAWQRFLATGPLAFLPLGNGQCSIVWSTAPDEAQRLLQLPEEAFCDELAAAFDHRLGAVAQAGGRAQFPLRWLAAGHYVRPRIALVGDAAHTVHPLAGQGVNLGFLDVAVLTEVLVEARARGKDPGGMSTLRRYERRRKGDNLRMQFSIDQLKKLFASTIPPLRWARNLGLSLLDQNVPLKNFIIAHATGTAGDMPKLTKPAQKG